MSPAPEKPNVIRRIVSLKQLLKRWRNSSAASNRIPPDVPAGHIAVYVGAQSKRFIVRATYLNHPIFIHLLQQAEEEFGFVNQGPLLIPCDESAFEEALLSISRSHSSSPRASIWLRETRCFSGADPRPPLAQEKFIC